MGRAPAPLTRGGGWVITLVVTLTMAVSYIDRQVLAALAVSIQTALHFSNEEYGWLQSGFAFAYLVGAPIAGALLDRIGARRGLLASVLLWSMVAAAHALAPSFAALLVLRIALGVTEAPSFPGAAQVVRRVLPAHDRSAGFGFLFTGSSLGSIVAAPLALALDARFGWRVAFFGSAVIGLAWVPLWLLVTRGRAAREALTSGLDGAQSTVPSRLHVLIDPAVTRAIVLVFASAPTIMFVLQWFPKYLHAAYALPKLELARYLWAPPLFFDLGAVGVGAVASIRDRSLRPGKRGQADPADPAAKPHRVRMHGDLVILGALATAMLATVPYARGPLGATILGSIALFGGGALYGRLTADMLAHISPARASMACGFTSAAQSLISIVVNPIIGRLADVHGLAGYHQIFVALGLVAIPGALAWIAWPMRRRPEREVQPPPAVTGTAELHEP